jgi:TolB-like protein/Tfp pilus assembly protein PilF/class 3 adenylate cyclase
MAETEKTKLRLEIAHVLFIDIVAYSKLRINDQSDQIQRLREIVRGTEQFRSAEAEGKLLRLPTGDGGALVFRNNPEAPVLCALEIAKALKDYPELRVRMGIHSGPVNEVTDLNEQANIAGAGINIAQRIMDCGDAGHILVSKHAAEDLEQYDQWQPYLHDLGQCEVKHGERLQVVNLYTDEVGNRSRPTKFQNAARTDRAVARPRRLSPALIVILSLIALAMVSVIFAPAIMKVGIDRRAVRSSGGEDERRSAASTPVTEKSIAVLPFENLSRDPDNAYFADGIQDEILTRLSKVAALKVISRTSTQKYKSAPDNLREVGKQLGVTNLLEGSVQKISNAVHINVQLIRAATDEHLWAESYNRKLDDVFGVEGEVASAIAEQLNAKLTGAEAQAVKEKPTQNPAAYDAYLRGVAIEESRTDDAAQPEAIANYNTAVRLDPKFALAWARLAVLRSVLYFDGYDLAANSPASVKEAADKAMALQPELGEAFVAQGVYRYRVLRDFRGALESYAEALKHLPNSSLVHEQMAHVERRLGEWDAAEKHYRTAVELDPRNVDCLSALAELLAGRRHFAEAQATWDRVLEVSPDDEATHANKASAFQAEGRLDEAAREVAKFKPNSPTVYVNVVKSLQLDIERKFDEAIEFIQTNPLHEFADDPRTITGLALNQEWAGHKEEARATFARAVAAIKPTPDTIVPIDSRTLSAFLAWDYSGLGQTEKALEQAKSAMIDYKDDALAKPQAEIVLAVVQARSGDVNSALATISDMLNMPYGITRGQLRLDPIWDPLRKDPRFQKLCEEKSK